MPVPQRTSSAVGGRDPLLAGKNESSPIGMTPRNGAEPWRRRAIDPGVWGESIAPTAEVSDGPLHPLPDAWVPRGPVFCGSSSLGSRAA